MRRTIFNVFFIFCTCLGCSSFEQNPDQKMVTITKIGKYAPSHKDSEIKLITEEDYNSYKIIGKVIIKKSAREAKKRLALTLFKPKSYIVFTTAITQNFIEAYNETEIIARKLGGDGIYISNSRGSKEDFSFKIEVDSFYYVYKFDILKKRK